jgi:signal transduction histidine kinase
MRLRPRRESSPPAHTRPIRSTLAALLVVPLASLIVLWAYETGTTARDALARWNYDAQVSATSGPGQALAAQLAAERQQSYALLTGPFAASRSPLNAQRARTDAAVAAFRRSALAARARGALDPSARQDLSAVLAGLARLGAIRAAVDIGRAGPLATFEAYDRIINDTFGFLGSQAAASSTPLYQEALAALDMSRALEAARREAALADGAALAHRPLTPGARDLFGQSVGAERLLEAQAMPGLGPELAGRFRALFTSPAYGSFLVMEAQLLQAPPGGRQTPPGAATQAPGNAGIQPSASAPPASGAQPASGAGSQPPGLPGTLTPGGWRSAAVPFLTAFAKAAGAAQAQVSADVRRQDQQTLARLGLTGGLGLLAIIVSLGLLLRFGRRLTRELTSLQRSAREVAEERLPQIVQKLRDGADVDPAADAVPIGTGRTAEVALVAQALTTLQRNAIEAAAGQARLRHGVSQVFLSLSRRSQSLLHRQLSMLDAMERGTSDPETLADLFRLDHLTTRMRRHAEGLIIISGAVPARGWREPVPVIDVIRAAIAEVEDYVRVDVVTDTTEVVAGVAVADLVHLLAELIENATMFSPSGTRVEVRASRVGNGFAVEIEDRGIGLAPGTAAVLNERLASPPEFDLVSTDQLGLFVVSRLASRHGIKVALRDSAFGGVTAVVLLPHSLVLSAEQAQAGTEAGQPAAGQQAPGFGLTGRRPSPPAPAQPPRFMGPAVPPPGSAPAAVPLTAAARPVTRLAAAPPAPPGPPARPGGQVRQAGDDLRASGLPASPGTEAGGAESGSGAQPQAGAETGAGAQAGGAESGSGAQHPAGPQARTGAEARASGAARARPVSAGEYRGLPMRVRQASLAPQLRHDPPPRSVSAAAQPHTPEEARAIMAALQRGWQRGRADGDPSGDAKAEEK